MGLWSGKDNEVSQGDIDVWRNINTMNRWHKISNTSAVALTLMLG